MEKERKGEQNKIYDFIMTNLKMVLIFLLFGGILEKFYGC